MKSKSHIWYESRFWIFVYATITTAVMCLQFLLGLFQKDQIVFNSQIISSLINSNLDLPMTTLSWGWTALVSLYCGSDRVVDTVKSLKLSVGQTSMGDLSKLRAIIVLSLFLLIVAIAFSALTEKDYDLNAWASAFVMTIVSYTVGNKAVKIAGQYGPKIDKNNNGIPDEVEDAYNKWKRAQIKDGVDAQFITFDYFLDCPENKAWEMKYRGKKQ